MIQDGSGVSYIRIQGGTYSTYPVYWDTNIYGNYYQGHRYEYCKAYAVDGAGNQGSTIYFDYWDGYPTDDE